jgi:hypothetical protein
MLLAEKFYILVLDEIRNQPNLSNEWQSMKTAINIADTSLDILVETLKQGNWQQKLFATGLQTIRDSNPPLACFARDLGDWHSWKFKDKTANYESLCRSALLNLSLQQLDKAETKINEAKFIDDDWAYAHHLYGLLRGIQENREGACFELNLALHRESSDVVKQRIERAINLFS